MVYHLWGDPEKKTWFKQRSTYQRIKTDPEWFSAFVNQLRWPIFKCTECSPYWLDPPRKINLPQNLPPPKKGLVVNLDFDLLRRCQFFVTESCWFSWKNPPLEMEIFPLFELKRKEGRTEPSDGSSWHDNPYQKEESPGCESITCLARFQTPGLMTGPQKHTDQTPNLRRYLED